MFKILDPPFLLAFSIIFEKLMKNRFPAFITKKITVLQKYRMVSKGEINCKNNT
jgi:hypothetical protein